MGEAEQRQQDWRWWVGLTLAALVMGLIRIGDVPLRDSDEAQVSLVAREMICTDNWLFPTRYGEPYLNKPLLIHWLTAWTYTWAGFTDWATRLWPAGLSSFAVPLLYGLGRLLFKQQRPAALAALVLLTLLPTARHGRLAMLDGTVNTFYLLAYVALLAGNRRPPLAVGFGLGLGLVALTKGLLALPLGAIGLGFLLWDRPAGLRNPYLWLGLVLGAMPISLWYLAQGWHYGAAFMETHLVRQSLARVWDVVGGNTGPPWFYLVELLKYAWPWLIFWPPGLVLAWRARPESWAKLVLIGSGGFLGLISLMVTKFPWYIMPLYPFLALAVGAKLADLEKADERYPWIWTVLIGLLAVGCLGGTVYFVLTDPESGVAVATAVLALTLGLTVGYLRRSDPRFIPVLIAGLYLGLVAFMASTEWNWELNEDYAVKPVAALVRAQVPPGQPIYISRKNSRRSLNFYSGRLVETERDPQRLEALWANRQPYLLLNAQTLAQVTLPGSRILGEAEGYTLVAPVTPRPISPDAAGRPCPLPPL